MIRNYLKTAFRNLARKKAHSFINIAGLAAGMALAILISLWIWDAFSHDKYYQNYARLGRLMSSTTFNGETETYANAAAPLAAELRNKYGSDFKSIAISSGSQNHLLEAGGKKITKPGSWVQPALPVMLTLRMLQGDAGALNDPSSILISRQLATTLFGNADPMQQAIQVDDSIAMKVAGVYEDLPTNGSFAWTFFLLPWNHPNNPGIARMDDWNDHHNEIYVQLNSGIDVDKTTAKIKDITKPHIKGGSYESMLVHPMSKWFLYNEFKNGKNTGGLIDDIRLFGAIGFFVLLLACINFMNLATARSEKRAKEVGIRKAIGSMRQQLVLQFLSESLVVTFIAALVAIALAQMAIPFFNELAGSSIAIPWGNAVFWLCITLFTVVTSIIAGSYPAFYLSAFKPVKVLKGTFRIGRFAALPRKVLVTVQFTVSIALAIGAITVYRQIQFARNRPVGYTRAGLITTSMNATNLKGHYDAIRNDLLATGVVDNMSQSSSPSTNVENHMLSFKWQGMDTRTVPLIGTVGVTHDYGSTLGWTIKAGRDFSRNFPSDSGALILNETAVKLTGFKNPVGETMRFRGKDRVITGVVKDMVLESPYKPVEPNIFILDYAWTRYINVRIKPTIAARDAITKIETVFKKYSPGTPFLYRFADESYNTKFAAEEETGRMVSLFVALAIFISCLGLFGMASFMAEQRTKEIGVRKILGASVFNLWGLLSKDFITLVTISLLIASPVAWYFMHQWLQNFQYRTSVSWWIFLTAGASAMIITIFTVSFQSIKAALANPADALKNE